MKRPTLRKISLSATPEAEDAIGEMLGRIFKSSASIHTDLRTGRTTVSVFSESPLKVITEQVAELKNGLAELKTLGVPIKTIRIRVEVIPHEDWAESWKRHFKPMEIGKSLLVKPSWSKRPARRGQAVVILDPGLSFGTGQHATTSFCLHELARHRQPAAAQSFLDIGTGSGILAIAAAKLGYSPVEAFDFDPESVRVTKNNSVTNNVADKLRLYPQDLTKLPLGAKKRFDVVCANLISTLLIAERERIIARVKPGGVLVLAGILKTEFALIRRTYEAAGLKFVVSKAEREWMSGSFLLHARKI